MSPDTTFHLPRSTVTSCYRPQPLLANMSGLRRLQDSKWETFSPQLEGGLMSYLIELQTQGGRPGYVVADGDNREEALAHVHEQLGVDDEEEFVVLAVHTVQ